MEVSRNLTHLSHVRRLSHASALSHVGSLTRRLSSGSLTRRETTGRSASSFSTRKMARRQRLDQSQAHGAPRGSRRITRSGDQVPDRQMRPPDICEKLGEKSMGSSETGPTGVIFPWEFPATENLKGVHISERISGNAYRSQVPSANASRYGCTASKTRSSTPTARSF